MNPPGRIVIWTIGLVVACAFLPVEAADQKSPQKEDGVAKEIQDLGQEIRKAMREKGEYIWDSLSEWRQKGTSWSKDRALQARVKTALAGVLGVSSVATINVDVAEGVVTLEGELKSWDQVARAVRTTHQVKEVRRVVSRLTVSDSV